MANANAIKVWDPLVRIFHWLLVIAFFTAYATGEEIEEVHEWMGYTVLGLVVFRIVWGFVGPAHARFTDFVRGPGVSRLEYEFEIPFLEATEMLNNFCPLHIVKKRYEIKHANHLWEVDIFEGRHAGLMIAEIELSSEDEIFEKPNWVMEDVSNDPSFFNSNLG